MHIPTKRLDNVLRWCIQLLTKVSQAMDKHLTERATDLMNVSMLVAQELELREIKRRLGHIPMGQEEVDRVADLAKQLMENQILVPYTITTIMFGYALAVYPTLVKDIETELDAVVADLVNPSGEQS